MDTDSFLDLVASATNATKLILSILLIFQLSQLFKAASTFDFFKGTIAWKNGFCK